MKGLLVLIGMLASCALQAAIHEEEVRYTAGSTELKGYLVYDDAKPDKRPGILVVHEWWGLNDYARKRARMLAELGYTALAVDMYGAAASTEHGADAKKLMEAVANQAGVAKERFVAAKSYLETQSTVDAQKIGAIGYCFGGATVLDMARQEVPLAAVVSFHGSLATNTPARKGAVKGRILVLNGEGDTFITPESVAAFKYEMTEAQVNFRFVSYPGAKHGFTNPDADRLGKANDMPLAYDEAADKQSWEAMQELIRDVFEK